MTYPPDGSPSTYRPEATPPTYQPGATSPTYPSDGTTAAYPAEPESYTNPIPVTQTAPTAGADDSSGSSTADVAKEQASEVTDTAAQAGHQVAGLAKEQVANVAAQTQTEAKNLLGQTRDEVTSQAGTQQQRVAGGLRSLGEELQAMSSSSEQDGPATQFARQAAERISTTAGWLEDREPGQVLNEVKHFARQRPGAFLALAAAAGLLAGRLTRGLTDDSRAEDSRADDSQSPASGTGAPTPMQPADPWQATGAGPDPALGHSMSPVAGSPQFDPPPPPPPPPPAPWTQDPTHQGNDPVTGWQPGQAGYPDPNAGRIGQ